MDPARFDRLSKLFATRRTRRQALAAGGAGIAAGGLLASILPTSAQDATPAATPAPFPSDPHPSADSAMTHPEYLFVQPFDAGTWTPKPGEEGTYLLTLTGVAENTTYFSDRPERITGLAPTQPFLDGLGFISANPPNAAIVAQTDVGEQDVLIVQLFDPIYDAAAATLVYDARILADYGGRGLAHLAQQQTDYELAASFGEGSLFIDDCPDIGGDNCYFQCENEGSVNSGQCWSWSSWTCNPCGSNSNGCNQQLSGCNGNGCVDDMALCGGLGCCQGQCCVNNGVMTCPC
jgi:hypothetical protein